MADTAVALPATIRPATSLTPNEMRMLKASTGRELSDLLGGDAEDMDRAPDRIQSMVWVALRRAGHDVAWEDAGDIIPDMSQVTPDPTNGGPPISSSTSVGSGG